MDRETETSKIEGRGDGPTVPVPNSDLYMNPGQGTCPHVPLKEQQAD